jgi:hypothetical protein
MAQIELGSKDVIKPYVIVDEDLLDYLSQYKWRWQSGYAATTITAEDGSRKTVKMHRLIAGAKPGDIVDHINRVRYDNRRANLRLATVLENSHNKGKIYGPFVSSDYVGVSLYGTTKKPRWKSTIAGNVLGIFDDEQEAAYVRDQAALQLHGEFAYTNFDYAEA